MKSNFKANKVQLIAFFLVSLFAPLCLSQNSTSTNIANAKSYKTFTVNTLFEVYQNYSSVTYKLNLTTDVVFNYNFIIIDIIIVSYQDPNTKFVACLNFNEDPLLNSTFIYSGAYSCSHSDKFATLQQKSQHLLVINNTSSLDKNDAYLTVFYQNSPHSQLSPPSFIKEAIKYDVFIYYFNQYPCHSNCNGQNGSCNGQTGLCVCKPDYFELDCGVYLQPLSLKTDRDHYNIIVSSYKTLFFKISMKQLIEEANGSKVSLNFRKYNGFSKFDLKLTFNELILPDDNTKHVEYQISGENLTISDIEELCALYFPPSLLSNSLPTTNNQSEPYEIKDCFIVIAIKQINGKESNVVTVLPKFQENILISGDDHNKSGDQITENKNSNDQLEESSSDKKLITIIIATTGGSVILLFFGVAFRVIYKRYKANIDNRHVRMNDDIEGQTASRQSRNLIQQLNFRLKTEQKKKHLTTKKHLLQNCLMPIQFFIPQASTRKSLSSLEQHLDAENTPRKQNIDQKKNGQDIENACEEDNNNNDRDNRISSFITPQMFSPKNDDLFLLEQKKNSQDDNQQNGNQHDLQFNFEEGNQENQDLPQYLQLSQSLNSNKLCCAICLMSFKSQQKVRQTICQHTFHNSCLNDWLAKDDNCPLCRQSFEIMDMIDYVTKKQCQAAANYEQRLQIMSQKNYIESRLQEQQERIIELPNEDFLKIFQSFFPQLSNDESEQEQENQQQQMNIITQSPSNQTETFKTLKGEQTSAQIILSDNEEKDEPLRISPIKKEKNETKQQSFSPLKFIFSKNKNEKDHNNIFSYQPQSAGCKVHASSSSKYSSASLSHISSPLRKDISSRQQNLVEMGKSMKSKNEKSNSNANYFRKNSIEKDYEQDSSSAQNNQIVINIEDIEYQSNEQKQDSKLNNCDNNCSRSLQQNPDYSQSVTANNSYFLKENSAIQFIQMNYIDQDCISRKHSFPPSPTCLLRQLDNAQQDEIKDTLITNSTAQNLIQKSEKKIHHRKNNSQSLKLIQLGQEDRNNSSQDQSSNSDEEGIKNSKDCRMSERKKQYQLTQNFIKYRQELK